MLSLPADRTSEGKLRKKFTAYALNAIRNIVDPEITRLFKFQGGNDPWLMGIFCTWFSQSTKAIMGAADWTAKKAWSGQPFRKDGYVDY